MPEQIVIADTSCLIALSKLKLLDALKTLYSNTSITPTISKEFNEPLPKWVKIQEPKNKNYQRILENILDKGEASAIALALDYDDVLLILDDLKGRKEAQKIGFKITGTLGILHKCKQSGIIYKIKPSIEKLKKSGFRISQKVEEVLLNANDEF